MRSASQSLVVRRRRTVERKRFLRLSGVRVARSWCAHCGRLAVRPFARPGRTMRYRTLLAFPVPADCAIPTCSRCQSEYVGTETRERLGVLLAPLYERELTHRLQLALKEVLTVISQRKLELQLGLSQGYLSRLLTGAGRPSEPLLALLMLLAGDPKARLMELERLAGAAIPMTEQDLQRVCSSHANRSAD
jgi:hypothetical protein